MTLITLSNHTEPAIIDSEDYDYVISHNNIWFKQDGGIYCRSKIYKEGDGLRAEKVSLHRTVLRLPQSDEFDIDHINRNCFDNRKENLRKVKHWQNLHNVPKRLSVEQTSIYKGVSWHKKGNKWQVHLSIQGKRYYGGLFKDEVDAAKEANRLMITHIGECAYLNNV